MADVFFHYNAALNRDHATQGEQHIRRRHEAQVTGNNWQKILARRFLRLAEVWDLLDS